MSWKLAIAALALFGVGPIPADARTWLTPAALVVVVDGDTLTLGGERVRLWGIDAPESGQPCERDGKLYDCGASAQAALLEMLAGRDLWCEARDRDRYGRTVAACRIGAPDGPDLGAGLVRAGWAIDYRRYSKGRYARDEASARRAGLGLWEGRFTLPETCRRERCTVTPGAGR